MKLEDALQYVEQTAQGAHPGQGWSEGADNNALRVLAAEVVRLRSENERCTHARAEEMDASNVLVQRLTASRDSFLKENGRLKKGVLTLATENAELRAAGEAMANRFGRSYDGCQTRDDTEPGLGRQGVLEFAEPVRARVQRGCRTSDVVTKTAVDDGCLEKYDALEFADAEDWCPSCGAHWPDRALHSEKLGDIAELIKAARTELCCCKSDAVLGEHAVTCNTADTKVLSDSYAQSSKTPGPEQAHDSCSQQRRSQAGCCSAHAAPRSQGW